MNMEISNDKIIVHTGTNNASVLPSLFANHAVSKDGLIAINDNSLTQQIEFILQDTPITEQDDEETQQTQHNSPHATYVSNSYDEPHVNMVVNAKTALAANRTDNPPNTNCASQQQMQINQQQQQQQHITHTLNGRGIIIQSTRRPIAQDVEEDPELNDENLQDIEAETQESEAELQTVDENYAAVTQIKLEQFASDLEQNTFRPTQLLLPSGTIVSTTNASLPALPNLQRRPVFISEVSNVEELPPNTTIINMRNNAVIRNASIMNMVQPNVDIIQQAVTPSSIGTSVVVTSANHVLPANVSIVPLRNAQQIFNTINATTVEVPSSTNIELVTTNSNNNQQQRANKSAKKAVRKSNNNNNNNSKSMCSTADTNNRGLCSAGALLCMDCPERFDSKELFDIHRSGHINNMKCAICNMVLKSLKNYEKHCLRCKPYECQICGRIVRFRPNFIKHMRVHTACQAAERHKYKCEVCHKEFMSFEYFKVHKKIHSENVNLTCEICGKVFSALASLRGHSKLHSGHKLHKCEVCGKGFGQRYNLKIHARTHTGEFPYECAICKKKLHTEKALESHMKIHQCQSEGGARNRYNKKSKNAAARAAADADNRARFERPSTSGLQQLCAIASDNLKNFNNQIDSTTMNETTEGETLNSIAMEDFSNDSISMMSQDPQYLQDGDDDDDDDDDTEQEENDDDDNEDNNDEAPTTSTRAPARTIVINNFVQNKKESHVNSVPKSNTIGVITQSGQQQQQLQKQHTQVIQSCGNIKNNNNNNNSNSVLKQQLMRQTPIIQTAQTSYIVQETGTSPNHSASPTPTICSSRILIASNNTASGIGTTTIRSVGQPHEYSLSTATNILVSSKGSTVTATQSSNNHRNQQQTQQQQQQPQPHQTPDREVSLDVDDDAHVMDEHDIMHQTVDGNSCNSVLANDNATIISPISHQVSTIHHARQRSNGEHFDDDTNDDDKSSPSLATTAIIKQEPNFYSSAGSADNSNEMLIKEEVIFEDSQHPHSPRSHSSLSTKFCMTNFDTDHHGTMDLNHTLPPYGHLFETHSIPDTIPFARMDDDDFHLDHSSLGGLHNTSNSTTDGEFIKKEWVYGTSNNFNMNSKFDEDTDPMCEPASFIYN